ncbi:MAG: RNA polymerase sigma factor [Pseudomonadales bacterium]
MPQSFTDTQPSDADLVARVLASNDMQAFGLLVARHERGVRAMLGSLCRGQPAVEDLAQETFIRALDRLSQARDPERLGAWLNSIAYREFLMWRRSRSRYTEVLAAVADTAPVTHTPDHETSQLDRYLAVLADNEREAIVLCHGAGLSHGEVAAAMALPLGTVKSLIQRGKIRIQKHFGATEQVQSHA